MTTFIKSKAVKAVVGLLAIAVIVGGFGLSAKTANAATCTAYTFGSGTYKYGSSSAYVKEIQQFLNANGFTVSTSGTGSAGMESMYFGTKTKAAVMAFQSAKALTADGIYGPLSRAAMLAHQANNCTVGGPVQTGPVTAMLSTDNPASGTLVATQATADLAHFTFSGTGTVTNVTLQRIGVSADSTLSNVYLFDGATRLTDAASVTNGGIITFNNAAGLFMVSGSKTIAVKADILTGTSGQTVGVKLNSFTTSASMTPVTTSISGNTHTIAQATLAGVAAGSVTPSGSTINPGPAQTLWQSTLTITQRDVWLKRMALRQIGSAPSTAMTNFKLYVNGVQVGPTVASIDAMGYVTFDLSATPALLTAGSRLVRVDADVVSGASRTIQLSVRQASDVDFVDKDYNVNITPASTPWTASSAITISGGTGGSMVIQKDTTMASADVTADASDVAIGRFTAQAFGEAIKIETIKAAFYSSDATIDSLRNGRVLINGVQYGSTATLLTCDTDSDADCDGSDTSGTGTSFTLNYTVPAGQTATIEIHADMYDNDGSNGISANDTIIGAIAVGSSNAVKQDSLGYLSTPSSITLGQTMTVKTASATLSKNTSYANQTINIPQTMYKLGDWNITAGTAEDLNVNTVALDFTAVSGSTFTAADLTNVYVKVGNNMSNTYATVSATSNTFSVPSTMVAKGTSVAVQVYANILSGGITATDSVKATATVSGNSAVSGTSVTTSAVDGQTIAYNTGSFSISLDGSSPVNRAVSGNQVVVAGAYKFQATNDTFTVKELDISVSSATVASAVSMVSLYDGANLVASLPFSGNDADSGTNNMASFTGLSWAVPANTTKVLTVDFTLNNIGTGAGTSQQNAAVQIDRVKYMDSAGSITTPTTDINGNELYVYKAIPTVAQQTVDTTTKIVNGSQRDLYKFTITAPSATVSPNGITVKQFRLKTTWNDGGAAGDALKVDSFKVLVDGSDVTTSDVTIQDQSGNSIESTGAFTEADSYAVVSWSAGKELSIGAGQTRTITVRGTPQGFNVTDATANPTDSVGFNLLADTAHNSTKVYLNGTATAATLWGLHTAAAATGSGTIYEFIWSDVSANPHATAENASSSGDWANSYKIFDDLTTQQFND